MAGRAVASILAAGKRHRPTCFDDDDDEPQFVGELSWQERDAAARARAVELTDSPVESRQHSRIKGAADAAFCHDAFGHPDPEGAAALAALSSDSGDEEAVQFVGQRSWKERDDAARAAAVDVEHAPELRAELRADQAASASASASAAAAAAASAASASAVASAAAASASAAAASAAAASASAASAAAASAAAASASFASWSAAASRVKPEPACVKPEPPPPLASPLTQPAPSVVRPRVPSQLPSGFATAAAPPLFDPNAGLDPDQRRALSVALSGRSLFLTGGAGVGKSFTLRRIVGALQQRHGINAVAVTARLG